MEKVLNSTRRNMREGQALVLILAIALSLFSFAVIAAPGNVVISSSGKIAITLPLHVDGRYIKDSLNRTIYLRGVWAGHFGDTSTGWWEDAYTWNEAALRHTLQTLQQQWGANCINTYFWGDWWLENKAVTLNGDPTNIGLKDAVIKTVQIAAEYGIYFQVRLYGCIQAEGRREGLPFAPYSAWSVADFVNFWIDVATTLKDYPNVIFCLFDEPNGVETTYFDAASQAISAIRAAGANQPIAIHWGYCGDMMWVADWVNGGYPLTNIIFSEHIYRNYGTFNWNNNYPVDINSIRSSLSSSQGEPYGTATKYIMDTYNVPVWVSAIGAINGASNDEEYVAFRNTLEVLNELGTGYVDFAAFPTTGEWTPLIGQNFSTPNRVGQGLIDAIAGIVPPPIYQITLDSNIPGTLFKIGDNTYSTPFTGTKFAGNYTVSMPSSIKVYSHTPLFGETTIRSSGGGYYVYIYTAGPYTINSSATVSSINLYTVAAGKAKVAIYNSTTYSYDSYPPNWSYPNDLIVASGEQQCPANTWNTFNITTTTLNSGTYFLAIKIDTNGMITYGPAQGYVGQVIAANYADPFPNPFGTIQSQMGANPSVYIPLAPIQTATYNFTYWEDQSTNPTRTISLTTNMTLTATYQKTP
jgi:hypothetical protein